MRYQKFKKIFEVYKPNFYITNVAFVSDLDEIEKKFKKSAETTSKVTCGELLIKFFEWYGFQFNTKIHAISINHE